MYFERCHTTSVGVNNKRVKVQKRCKQSIVQVLVRNLSSVTAKYPGETVNENMDGSISQRERRVRTALGWGAFIYNTMIALNIEARHRTIEPATPAFPSEAVLPAAAPVDVVELGEPPVVVEVVLLVELVTQLTVLLGEVFEDVPPKRAVAKPTAGGDCLNTVYTFFKNASPTMNFMLLSAGTETGVNADGSDRQ